MAVVGFIAFVMILFIPFDSKNSDIDDEQNAISNFIANSIVNDATDFTESDDNAVTQFLDSNNVDSPLSTEKFGIEIQTVLFDSSQKKYPESSIIGLPQLSVTDDEGRLLDLGSIQTSFSAVLKSSSSTVDVSGTVEFYLDDNLIKWRK